MSKRDEDRARKEKQRRQKRLQKKASRGFEVLESLRPALATPPPATWPGAAEAALERPDLVKAEVGAYIFLHRPGPEKMRRVEDALKHGLLGFLPDLHDWAMEVVLYHGVPGDPWHPIDAYLQAHSEMSPAGRKQLLRWKQARIGLFQIGEVRDDTLSLSEWDPITERPINKPFQAISLSIGGVNVYRSLRGKIHLGYVAPWAPEQGLYCSMGYGPTVPQELAAMFTPYLGLNHLDVVLRPVPWEGGPGAVRELMPGWRARDWHAWLTERLEFPFWATLTLPPPSPPQVRQVRSLMPSTPEQARNFGIYFEVPKKTWLDKDMAAGGTSVLPVDVASGNFAALREYHAYRQHAGPPPGMAGKPAYFSFGPSGPGFSDRH